MSNFAKVFEISVYSFIFPRIRNDVASQQHVFFPNRSTATNLVYFTQYLADSLDCRKQVDVIFTDFSRAFDRIDHSVLCAKLRLFNFGHDVISFFRSYLSNRQYYVSYSGFSSRSYVGTSGVPQGSNLGPLLFILFINDLPSVLGCSSLLYADDLKLFSNVSSVCDQVSLQTQLNGLWEWCQLNKLHLNIDKCKVMSFTRRKEPMVYPYSLGQSSLGRVGTFRDLGVYFDCELSFNHHIAQTVKSAYKMLGFIIRNSDEFVSAHALKSLYYSYVRSKLDYCSVVWSPYYEVHRLVIEGVQRRFLKYLYLKKHGVYPERGYPNGLLLREFESISLAKRRILAALIFLIKLVRGNIDCAALFSQIQFRVPRPGSRYDGVFLCPQPRTNIMLKSPVFVMTRSFNLICREFDIQEGSLQELCRLVDVHF